MCVTVSFFFPPAVVIIGFTIDKKKDGHVMCFGGHSFSPAPAILVAISALLGSRWYVRYNGAGRERKIIIK